MINLRHYQKGCAPAVIDYINDNPDKHPLVALPTGSGKTYCIADLIKKYREQGKQKILVVSHVKEILEQNHESISKYLGEEVGLNSAGLGRREHKDITVAGIQSIYREHRRFKDHDLIIIDEAHLISTKMDTMYRTFLENVGRHNLVGFTATPFRLGSGYIYGRDAIFDDLVYDWTTLDRFQQLVDEGYLSQLTTKRTAMEMDTTDIKLIGGDYNEKALAQRFDRPRVTEEAIKEILAAGKLRKKWLIFAIDISHAEHIAETLIRNGIKTVPVHSTMSDSGWDRDSAIEGFKNGKYQALVNVNILTTGFDEPGIDLIAMLRPTKSPVLHVQSLGRGSRICDGKTNCLVLDFAGNTTRLGPINNVQVIVAGKGKGGGEPITKTCPMCSSILPPAVRICPDCSHKFLIEHRLQGYACVDDVIDSGKPIWLTVDNVVYSKHANYGSPSAVKVTYHAEGRRVTEFVNVEHKGFAKHKADHWVKYRGGVVCNTADEVLKQTFLLKEPVKIEVQYKNKYLIIKDAQFEL